MSKVYSQSLKSSPNVSLSVNVSLSHLVPILKSTKNWLILKLQVFDKIIKFCQNSEYIKIGPLKYPLKFIKPILWYKAEKINYNYFKLMLLFKFSEFSNCASLGKCYQNIAFGN